MSQPAEGGKDWKWKLLALGGWINQVIISSTSGNLRWLEVYQTIDAGLSFTPAEARAHAEHHRSIVSGTRANRPLAIDTSQ